MEVLTNNVTGRINNSIVFPEDYSIQLFFKENKSFYVHKRNIEDSSFIEISEEPLEGVLPEVKFIFNTTVREATELIDSTQIQIRSLPRVDKRKALMLLAAAMRM